MPLLKIKPYNVPEENPFAEDFFERRQLIESVVNLAKKLEEPLVLGLTAPWGHGKSTIINRLKTHINKEHSHEIGIIHYDAFKNDYFSDIFVSVASSINRFIDECIDAESEEKKKTSIKTAKNNLLKTGGKICKSLLKNAAIRGIKYATSGVLDVTEMSKDFEKGLQDIADDSAEDIANESCTAIEDLIKERLLRASNDKELIDTFTEKLQIAVESTGKKRLIFIIDELDRCQPSFAVEVLEKIKHFFNCESVLFILTYNKEQLNQSIKHIYGVNNPNIYLQRFVDLESNLSIKTDGSNAEESINKFINWTVSAHEFATEWKEVIGGALKTSFKLFGSEFSLRSVERINTKVASYCLIKNDGEFVYNKNLIVFLAIFSVCRPEQFKILHERTKEISQTGHGIDPTTNLDSINKELSDLLKLIKNNNHQYNGHIYNYFIHYLYIKDGDNTGISPQNDMGMLDRKQYLLNCCNLISTLTIAE